LSFLISQYLLEKFVDHIAGIGVFEEDFLPGNLAEDDADAADSEAVESEAEIFVFEIERPVDAQTLFRRIDRFHGCGVA
jgi:hypothetical protein